MAPARARQRAGTPQLDAVFSSHAPAVLGYLRAAGAADPEDVLGEVFLRVARHLGRFRGTDAQLRSWLFTIAHRCLVDEQRRLGRWRRLTPRLDDTGVSPAPGEPFDPALVRALHRLTPEQRAVVTLRFVADLSLDEVAAITKRPVGAVKALQHRALRALAAQLADGDLGTDD